MRWKCARFNCRLAFFHGVLRIEFNQPNHYTIATKCRGNVFFFFSPFCSGKTCALTHSIHLLSANLNISEPLNHLSIDFRQNQINHQHQCPSIIEWRAKGTMITKKNNNNTMTMFIEINKTPETIRFFSVVQNNNKISFIYIL